MDRLLALRLAEQEQMLNAAPSAPYIVDLGVPTQRGGELVALPCEFCQAMVPANQLVIHETGCRPDLARYDPIPVPLQRHRKLSSSSEEDEDSSGLPCEFCGLLFPPQFLLQHQVCIIIGTFVRGGWARAVIFKCVLYSSTRNVSECMSVFTLFIVILRDAV